VGLKLQDDKMRQASAARSQRGVYFRRMGRRLKMFSKLLLLGPNGMGRY
jgi:hypothetical protein